MLSGKDDVPIIPLSPWTNVQNVAILTSDDSKNRGSNFLVDTKGRILPLMDSSSEAIKSKAETIKVNKNNKDFTRLLSTYEVGNGSRTKEGNKPTSPELLHNEKDHLTKLVVDFLDTNTVSTDVPAFLKRFDDYVKRNADLSLQKSGNSNQNSDSLRHLDRLDHLQQIQSHLETIKSENLELEGINHYQELVSKIQDKMRYLHSLWLMNPEINYPQNYPDVQAEVKKFKETKENCDKYHDEIHCRLLEASKRMSHSGEIEPHNQTALTDESHTHGDRNQTLLELDGLIEQYKQSATRYRELSQDIQKFADYVPQFKDDLQQKHQDYKHFKGFTTYFKCHKRRIRQIDPLLARRCERFIDHYTMFIPLKTPERYKMILNQIYPKKTISQKIKDLQARITMEDRMQFEKLQKKIIPEKRINIEDLQNPEFGIDSSNRRQWLDELRPKLDDVEKQQLNLLQGKLHPIHHLTDQQLEVIRSTQSDIRQETVEYILLASLVV